ncbi:hypothetical protein Vadar_030234 [Vaccinium darrowii]|uniref:Uncharacterized protein n=1 Tax=Vaccinium darrowii TaxID=229202 RepID=A0ACB7XKY5_9ERIC|nr:hypothetical protein Vadar_030234 [Vaccinium darrowii]
MTPLDFSAITGLRVGGEPLPFDSGIAQSDDALRYYLGWKPNHGADSAGYGQFADHCLGRPTSRLAAEQKARCYLLYMFGATLFANRRHHVHLGYLAALRDFDRVARYDWGGWALASCYAFMGSVSRCVATTIGGLWSVWELWAYEVLRLTSPESSYRDQRVIPRALRWGKGYRGKSAVRGQLDFFRGELDWLTSAGMWLCDKLKLVADPANDWVYQAKDWRKRGFIETRRNVEEWLDFFMDVEEEYVTWSASFASLGFVKK